jgi:hypothetical protein
MGTQQKQIKLVLVPQITALKAGLDHRRLWNLMKSKKKIIKSYKKIFYGKVVFLISAN